MDIEKILKLCMARYDTPDNILGKNLLIIERPELKELMRPVNTMSKGLVYRILRSDLKEVRIDIQGKQYLQYTKKDFPELWIDKTEE